MPKNFPPSLFYESKSREQLIREIKDLHSMLEAEREKRQVLSNAKDQVKSHEIPERDELFRMLFENMSEGFALGEPLLDANGNPYDFRFIVANLAFEEQTGLSREAFGKADETGASPP